MKLDVEKMFADMVANLLQTEFCPDYDPRLLHGCMGIASEGGEILEKYSNSIEMGGVPFDRTDILIELSDLLHYMQMITSVQNSSISDVALNFSYCNSGLGAGFYDAVVMAQSERLDPVLLRGVIGVSSRGGELLNKYKKFLFYHGEPFPREEMLTEISKLLFYIHMILDRLDSSIEEIMHINIAKLSCRYPNGYSHDKAITHQRDKKAERAAVDAVVKTFNAMRKLGIKGEEDGK